MASSSSSSVGKKSTRSTSDSSKTPYCGTKVGGLKRGPWTPDEDKILSNYVQKEGEGRWTTLPRRAGLLRCGKSCRLRWINYLSPSVKRGRFGEDEEDLILRLHRLLGNRWSLIAGRIPGRTDNDIKNYWSTYLSKKLISQGINPTTHKPLIKNSPNPDNIPPPPPPVEPNSNPAVFIHPSYDDPSTSISSFDMSFNEFIGNDDNITTLDVDKDLYDLETSDGFIMGLRDMEEELHHLRTQVNKEEDVVFSSFLDSLINDDVYVHQHPTTSQNKHVDSSALSFQYNDVTEESAFSSPDDSTNIDAFNKKMLDGCSFY